MSPPIKKWAFPMVRPGLACELLCSSFVSSVWRWESFSLMLLDGAWTLTTGREEGRRKEGGISQSVNLPGGN